MKTLSKLLLSTVLAVAGAGTAHAQSVGVFGDNIADPGNIPPILRAANAAGLGPFDANFPASPPNFGGRFSNGPVAAEILPGLLGYDPADVTNNAVGNAFSDQLPVSLAGGALIGNGSSIPGPIGRGLFPLNDTDIANQVTGFLAGAGPLGPDDLMLLYPSNNDAALALNTIALTAPPQDQAIAIIAQGAAVNAANTATQAQRLVDAGAGTVLVPNMPNIGLTPAAAAGGLSGQQLATLFSVQTNNALVTQLSAIAPGGQSVLIADIFTLQNDVAANPAKYGFADVTTPCSLVAQCLNAPQAVQDQFLFWDAFFPTAAGHRLQALFLADTVRAPRTIAALGETARIGTEAVARDLLAIPWREGFLLAVDSAYDFHERGGAPQALAYDAQGARIGAVAAYGFGGGFEVGVAASYTDADVAFQDIAAGFDRNTANIGGFIGYEGGLISLFAAASVGFDNFDDIARTTGVAGQISSGSTDGTSVSVSAQAMGNIPLSPAVMVHPLGRLGWSRSEVDGYAESGATGLSQIVFDQESEAFYGEAGLGLSARFGGNGLPDGQFWVRGTWHFAIDDDPQDVRTALVALPDFTRTHRVDAPDGDYGRIEASVAVNPVGKLEIGLLGHASFGGDDFDGIGGRLFVGVGF